MFVNIDVIFAHAQSTGWQENSKQAQHAQQRLIDIGIPKFTVIRNLQLKF